MSGARRRGRYRITGRSVELTDEGLLPSDPAHYRHLPYMSVKAAVLPFARFPSVDTSSAPG